MTKKSPLVSVILVSYNTKDLTLKAISSALASNGFTKGEIEIIVIDNQSSDGSVATIEANFPSISIIKNKFNKGFGGGNNQGLKIAKGDHILLLNTDAFLSKDSLRILVDILRARPDIISVGPQLIFENGQVQPSAGYLPTPARVLGWMWWYDKLPLVKSLFSTPYHLFDLGWYKEEQFPDWLMGACVLFRRSELLYVSGFDEGIFMYSEEVELFRRLHDEFGKKVLYTPKTQVVHLGSVSTKQAEASRLVYEIQGIFYIYQKYYPQLLWFIHFVIYTGVIMRMVIFSLIPSRRAIVNEYKKLFKLK